MGLLTTAFCQVSIYMFPLYVCNPINIAQTTHCAVAGATSDLLFPLGKKTQQHRINIIRHIKAAATRCCTCRGGRRQTQTSIKPSHHTSKHTDAPYHQGVNVEQIRHGGAAKQDNLLVFYRSVKAVTIRERTRGKHKCKIRGTLTHLLCFVKSKEEIKESVAASSIALYY